MHMKKGVSPVIATVLLVIITLVAVGILAGFVIPFVSNSFKDTKECYDVLNKVRFDSDSLYNCKVASTMNRTGFTVRVDSDQVVALKAILTKSGRGNTYSIESGTGSVSIRMLDRDFNQSLEVPTKGGVRTYVANDAYERVELSAVLKSGASCETRESLSMADCTDPQAVSGITAH